MNVPTHSPRPVLVTGATGFIGRHVVAALLRRGEQTVVLARDPGQVPADERVRLIEGDITDPAAVAAAVQGTRAVVHLAAATATSDTETAHRVNVGGTATLLDAAGEAGVESVVALSTITVGREKVGVYGETKREMEQLVLTSGIPAVVLRPSLVYGPGERGLSTRMVALIRTLPVVPVVGRGRQIQHPVHVDDVVTAILRSLDRPDLAGRCIDVVGPDAVTMDELLGRIQRTIGLDKRLVHIPVPLALSGARMLQAVSSNPPITVDNVIGADQPTPCDPEPIRRELGVRGTPLDAGLPSILDPAPDWNGGGRRPLRVAIVGLGKMGLAHTALVSALPGARVACLVDVDRRLARPLHGMGFDGPAFTSLEEGIEATRPDAVIIATPPDTHEALVRIAAARGVAVLVEKPLAQSLASAQAIARVVADAGVVATCGYTLAHVPAFERARLLLADGAIGEPQRFQASMMLSQVLGPKKGWMYEPERSGGGVLTNLTSHLLFLLHQYFGEATEVSATVRSLHTSIDDEASMRIRFGGVEGTLETSWSVPGFPRSRTTIHIEGSNGTLLVDDETVEVNLGDARAGLRAGATRLLPGDLPHPATFELGGEGYAAEDEDLIRALLDDRPPRVSIAQAVHVQAIIDAAYRSARLGGSGLRPGVPGRPDPVPAR